VRGQKRAHETDEDRWVSYQGARGGGG
jgi:hypothetical protein